MNRGEIFHNVSVKPKKNTVFPLSYENTLSLDMGDLVPVMVQEVLPGDFFKVNATAMVRFAPLLAPIMHRVDVRIDYFFVPNRLVWSKWSDFITGGEDGTLAPAKPRTNLEACDDAGIDSGNGSLFDYLGIPTGDIPGDIDFELIKFKGYQLIWNEYYRDQNLQNAVDIDIDAEGLVTDGSILGPLTTMRKKCWEKDYFTSALPWAQRGPEAVLSLGDTAPVTIPGHYAYLSSTTGLVASTGATTEPLVTGDPVNVKDIDASYLKGRLYMSNNVLTSLGGNLTTATGTADLSEVSGISLNDLRLLSRTQEWLEANARGGARYVEQIYAHWGVIVPDATIQRPQYLGGGKCPVQISEVLQTAQASEEGTTSSTDVGVGQMYGHGISVGSSFGFKRGFVEHGYVFGLMSVLPRTKYQQGLARDWYRFDKFDYAWNELAHLGEQEIYNKEIYANASDPDGTFGYQSRYAEYKYNYDQVHGDFKNSLNFWHLGRIFNSEPALNSNFVQADPSTRIFAVTASTVNHLWADLWFDFNGSRKLPRYGTPRF